MTALSTQDYRAALNVLRAAGEVDGGNPFPASVLEALRALVPCDVVSYHEQHAPTAAPEIGFTGEPRGAVTSTIRAAHRRYLHEDPLTPVDGARKYSDYLSRRAHHRLGLYQEADRPLGIEFMMRLWIDPRGAAGARLEFDRATSDFDERDRAVLDLLLPHLRQLRRAALVRRRLPQLTSEATRLSEREKEILGYVAEGRTNAEIAWALGISPATVRKHLEQAYAKLGVHTRTGAVAAAFRQLRRADG